MILIINLYYLLYYYYIVYYYSITIITITLYITLVVIKCKINAECIKIELKIALFEAIHAILS